jgi:c(7)-type cytochrome triheme protein
MKTVAAVIGLLVAIAGTAPAQTVAPADYGKVVMNSGGSQKESLAPVVFDHWLHRAKYTCRLCHIDIGFTMKAGTTGVKAADNASGLYCGVCHNGKMQSGGKTIFAACTADKSDKARCERCHSQGKTVKRDYDFATFTAKFPKSKLGNGVNWEKAAEDGMIQPVDFVEGVSIKKAAQAIQQDFTIQPKSAGVKEILFSHKKHSIWNGCESCHPSIFIGGKRGSTTYSMKEINAGKFCGTCHLAVAFPVAECDRCHSKAAK